jgi:hypothetical protein
VTDAAPSEHDRFLCAVDEPPYLCSVTVEGAVSWLPERLVAGTPVFPRCSPDGAIAYVFFSEETTSRPWLSGLAVVSAVGELVDLVPDAAPFSPPDWAPDGGKLLFLRSLPRTSRTQMILYEVGSGGEQILTEIDGLRCAAWQDDGNILCSTPETIAVLDREGRDLMPRFRHAVAATFRRYGIDDHYVTIDQLAPSDDPSRAALVLRWNQQGRPAREAVWVLEGEGLIPIGLTEAAESRSPRWGSGGRLAVAAPDHIRILGSPTATAIKVAGLHSFDWVTTP